MSIKWSMQGTLLGACSCDWGCPCSFDAPPTRGFCQGSYVWRIEQGKFGDVSLDGLHWSWAGSSPAAMHLGNVKSMIFIDDRANPAQREALKTIGEGKSGGPWTIFVAVTSDFLGIHYVNFDMHIDGLSSRVRAGKMLELELGPICNPVSGGPEEIYLDKPTGFTAKRSALGATKVFRVDSNLFFDHSGKYGEFSRFEYSGETPA